MKKLIWFIGGFACAMVTCLVVWAMVGVGNQESVEVKDASAALLSMEIPRSDLTEAKTGNPDRSTAYLSEAVVILLGGLGCSGDQLAVLKWWEKNHESSDLGDRNIVALFADPILGIQSSRYEAALLQRVSGVQFPIKVYEGQEFSLRSMGIRTPQVVLVDEGVISHVLPLAPGLYPPLPALERPEG